MKGRNYNIDVVRSVALLLVLIYHSWVLTGSAPIEGTVLYTIIALGGEIGVTTFFALSGYGIYCSLSVQESKEQISFKTHIKKRCVRIIPHYYICLFIVLLFMDGAYYLSKEHALNIASHIFLIHNLIPRYFGEINGVLWTMGVIFQFYIIAILIYKLLKKKGLITFLGTILFTISVKALIYKLVAYYGLLDSLSFFAGRQIFTALDNFVVGMYIAYIINEKNFLLKTVQGWIVLVASTVLLYVVCRLGFRYGIHTNNISGYIWHSMLALTIGGAMLGISFVSLNFINPIYKGLLWISKYEYGIYLWHMVFMRNLLGKSPIIIQLIEKGQYLTIYIIFIVFSVIIGYIFMKMVDNLVYINVK